MIRSLWTLSAAHLHRRRGRAVLTGLGVVLGVSMFFAVQTAVAGVGKGYSDLVDDYIGTADVQAVPVGAAGSVLSPASIAAVSALPDVKAATASLTVPASREDGATMRLVGVSDSSGQLFRFPVTSGRLAHPNTLELVATEGKGVQLGDKVGVHTPAGSRTFSVVGLLEERGLGQLNKGTITYTSLETARAVAGRGPVADDVRAVLNDGVTVAEWVDEHKHAVADAELVDAKGRFGRALGGLAPSMSTFAVLCLFIGAYLIYLTLSGAVLERTSEYGLLFALGGTVKNIRRTVLREALLLGGIACVVGLVVGGVLGLALTQFFASLQNLPSAPFTVSPGSVIAAFVLALGVSAVAALGPSRRAARISPTAAMRGDIAGRARLSRTWILGAVLLGLGIAVQYVSIGSGALLGGGILIVAGAVLLVPPLVPPIAALVGRVTGRLGSGAGSVAVTHMVREPGRAANTAALVMAVVGVGIGFGMTLASLNSVLDRALREQFGADISINSPNPIPPATVDQVKTTQGVAVLSEARFGSVFYQRPTGELRFNLFILDPATYFDVSSYAWDKGNDQTAKAALSQGGSVLVPSSLAGRYDIDVGDEIPLRTTTGIKPFRVAALFAASGGGNFSIVAGLPDGRTHFGAGAPHLLLAKATPDANIPVVRDRIKSALRPSTQEAGDPRFEVLDAGELNTVIHRSFNNTALIFNVIVYVGLLVGLLGLVNALVMSVLQRRREIGIFRAVGARARQIGSTVLVEALTTVGVAFILAIPVGLLVGTAFIRNAQRTIGYQTASIFPTAVFIRFAVITLILALAASLFPARRATRLTVVDSLRID